MIRTSATESRLSVVASKYAHNSIGQSRCPHRVLHPECCAEFSSFSEASRAENCSVGYVRPFILELAVFSG